MSCGFTSQELLDACLAKGHSVTATQLQRWRREGILQPAEQTYRKGVRGSAAVHPTGALTQVLAVCRLRMQERRFDELRLALWLEGHWVEPAKLKDSLNALASPIVDALKAPPSGARLEALGHRAENELARHPFVRYVSRRMKRKPDDVAYAFYVLLEPVAGASNTHAWEGVSEADLNDYSIVESLVGTASPETPPGAGAAELLEVSTVVLGSMSAVARIAHQAVVSASEEQLARAKAEVCAIAWGLPEWARRYRAELGDDFLAHNFLPMFARVVADDPRLLSAFGVASLAIPDGIRSERWGQLIEAWSRVIKSEQANDETG